MRRNIVNEVMAEKCIYGGLIATRAEVYDDIVAVAKSHGRTLHFLFVDRLVWMYPAATPEEAEFLESRGMTLAKMRDSV